MWQCSAAGRWLLASKRLGWGFDLFGGLFGLYCCCCLHGELLILREVSLPGKVDLHNRLLHPGFLGKFDVKNRLIAPLKEIPFGQ